VLTGLSRHRSQAITKSGVVKSVQMPEVCQHSANMGAPCMPSHFLQLVCMEGGCL